MVGTSAPLFKFSEIQRRADALVTYLRLSPPKIEVKIHLYNGQTVNVIRKE
jgi:hypothetical protein